MSLTNTSLISQAKTSKDITDLSTNLKLPTRTGFSHIFEIQEWMGIVATISYSKRGHGH